LFAGWQAMGLVDFSWPAVRVERLYRAVAHAFPLLVRLPSGGPNIQLLNVRLSSYSLPEAVAPGTFKLSREMNGTWLNIWSPAKKVCLCWSAQTNCWLVVAMVSGLRAALCVGTKRLVQLCKEREKKLGEKHASLNLANNT
jgi:hypothetical protein